MSIIERAKGSIFYDENRVIYRVKVPIGRDSKTESLKYKKRNCKTKIQSEKLIKKIQEVHNYGI